MMKPKLIAVLIAAFLFSGVLVYFISSSKTDKSLTNKVLTNEHTLFKAVAFEELEYHYTVFAANPSLSAEELQRRLKQFAQMSVNRKNNAFEITVSKRDFMRLQKVLQQLGKVNLKVVRKKSKKEQRFVKVFVKFTK